MQRAWMWVALAACSSSSKPPPPSPPRTTTPGCLADRVGTLAAPDVHDTACLADESCEAKCRDGVADACMLHGYAVQRAGDDAEPLYARACTLGLAIGCTNYGAGLWLGKQPASPPDERCARRLFDKACRSREPWGCGMVGRMMASDARTAAEQATARSHFDSACNGFGGVSCRMYALHLEKGQLGPAKPETVRALLLRACETGDPDACEHDTAGETFDGPDDE